MADDIGQWLEALGLGQYAQMFADNDIRFDVLQDLTDVDLKELGVSLGDRKRVLRAINDSADALSGGSPSISQPSEPQSTSEAERRQLTVMFCDLVGSTALSSRLDPEDMREIIRAYQDTCAGVVTRYEGFVAKYMGDGVLVYFGYPTAHEDDAERAINTGLEIVEAVGKLEWDLQVRIGIATGTVVVGDIVGDGASQEAAITGETPNLAARLQEFAEPNTVVIAAATHTLAGEMFECANTGDQVLKGFSDPIPVWSVSSTRKTESRFDATSAEHLTDLIGRDEEMEILLRRWERAKSGEGQVVLISGEPGIGKSRLLREIQERTTTDRHHRFLNQCSPYHVNSALYPVIQQLERVIAPNATDETGERLDRLESMIAHSGRPVEDVPLIASLISIEIGDRYPPLALSPQQQKELTLEALLGQLEGLALDRPLLFLFEDAHWIDPTTLELLDLAVERARDISVLMLITYRPEFEAPWLGQAHVTQMGLGRLRRKDCIALVDRLSTDTTLPEQMRERIAHQTDGVPLFIEELTKSVLENAGSEGADTVPATLQDSLEARLDRLGPAKEVAQIGAVIGRTFEHRLLRPVASADDDDLETMLGALVASGLVSQRGEPPEASYTFKHALVQDTAYGSLLGATRRRYHARIAKTLAGTFPETAETQPELLAHHYTEAGLGETAIPLWEHAGRRATERSAYLEAVAHLAKGLEVLAATPDSSERLEQELDLRVAYGVPLIATQGYRSSEVAANYARAQELCALIGDTPELFTVLYGVWRMYSWGGEWHRSHEIAARLVDIANESAQTAHHLESLRAIGVDNLYRGEFDAALPQLLRSVALYDPELHGSHAYQFGTDTGVYCRMFVGVTNLLLGRPDQAVPHIDAAVNAARSIDHPYTLGFALAWAALFYQTRRDVLRTRDLADELFTFSVENNMTIFVALGRIFRGRASTAMGDSASGMSEIEQGMAALEAKGVALGRTYQLGWLGEALGTSGKLEEGLDRLDEALAQVERSGERLFEAELHRLKGTLLVGLNGPAAPEAETSFRAAIEVAHFQSAKFWEIRAATRLARLWQAQDKVVEARDLLAPIYDLFTEGFGTADLLEAKALLDELS